MTTLHLKLWGLSTDTHDNVEHCLEIMQKDQMKISSFFDAVVRDMRSDAERGSMYVRLGFRLPDGKHIDGVPRDEVLDKIPDAIKGINYPFDFEHSKGNPLRTISEGFATIRDDKVIRDNTEIHVEGHAVPNLARIFFSNADPFEAMNAFAVLNGAEKDSNKVSLPAAEVRYLPGLPYNGYRVFVEGEASLKLRDAVEKNHMDISKISYFDTQARIFVDTPKLLKKVGLGKNHLTRVI